jgi:hypothetical protein
VVKNLLTQVKDIFLKLQSKALSPSEYAATTRAKRAGKAKGKQFVKQPPKVAKKTAGFR